MENFTFNQIVMKKNIKKSDFFVSMMNCELQQIYYYAYFGCIAKNKLVTYAERNLKKTIGTMMSIKIIFQF